MSTTTAAFRYHTELIDGVEVEKPLPRDLHARIQRFLLLYLERSLPPFLEALPELNVLCAKDRIVPDAVVANKLASYLDGDLADPPTLAVEIMSPGQSLTSLMGKCDKLLACDVPCCWVIWPEKKRAWIYSSDDFSEQSAVLTVPGMSVARVPLSEMWEVIS